jgi:hypothetical protein
VSLFIPVEEEPSFETLWLFKAIKISKQMMEKFQNKEISKIIPSPKAF